MEKTRLKIVLMIFLILLITCCATQAFATNSNSLIQVTGINTNVKGQSVDINWNKVQGANGYEVIFTVPESKTQWKYNWNYNSISFSKFPYGNGYKVEIRAFTNINGQKQYGKLSNPVFFDVKDSKNDEVKKLTQVTGVTTSIKEQNVTIKWNKVQYAEGYQIEITFAKNNSKWTYNYTSNQINFSGFPYGNNYKVEIKAYKTVNGKKEYGLASNPVYFDVKQKDNRGESKTLDKVTNLNAKVNGRNLVLDWKKIQIADGYEVVITNDIYKVKWIYEWDYNKMSFSYFPAGKGYKVKVRAYKTENGKKQYGNYSNIVSFNVN